MHVILLDLGLTLRGSQKQLLYLAGALRALPDMNVTVACPMQAGLADAAREQGLDLLLLPGHSHRSLRSLLRLRRYAKKAGEPVILHTHGPRAAYLGARCKRLWSERFRLLHTRANATPIETGWRTKAYLRADAIVGVSAETAHSILQTGIAPRKVSVIHSCIDPSQYPPRHNRGDGRFVFGVAGDLAPEKGYAVLVEALALFDEKCPPLPWEVRIVGQGPMFAEIIEQAEKMNVASHLALLGEQDTRYILPDCDTVIVPSVQAEGSNAAIKEAWSIGLPVIASDLPSNIELVHDEENGLTYLHSNPAALASAMNRIMHDRKLAETIAARGKNSVERFSPLRISENYVKLYQELVAQAAR